MAFSPHPTSRKLGTTRRSSSLSLPPLFLHPTGHLSPGSHCIGYSLAVFPPPPVALTPDTPVGLVTDNSVAYAPSHGKEVILHVH